MGHRFQVLGKLIAVFWRVNQERLRIAAEVGIVWKTVQLPVS
jgi:hypothetical protein